MQSRALLIHQTLALSSPYNIFPLPSGFWLSNKLCWLLRGISVSFVVLSMGRARDTQHLFKWVCCVAACLTPVSILLLFFTIIFSEGITAALLVFLGLAVYFT